MVILERSDPDRAVDVLHFAPDALVIDVSIDPGPTFTYHREEIPALPDAIVDATARRAAPARRLAHAAAPARTPSATGAAQWAVGRYSPPCTQNLPADTYLAAGGRAMLPPH